MVEVSSWCSSGNSSNVETCYDVKSRRYDRIDVTFNVLMSQESKSTAAAATPRWRWKLLWRKIMKEKKKLFDFSLSSTGSSSRMHFSYDPYAYSQNFDQGSLMWSDPDTISRSFSARFAVPARIFEKTELVQ